MEFSQNMVIKAILGHKKHILCSILFAHTPENSACVLFIERETLYLHYFRDELSQSSAEFWVFRLEKEMAVLASKSSRDSKEVF